MLPQVRRADRSRATVEAPLRANRVTPWGELEATPYRGSLMGNRGRLGPGGWPTRAWIACSLHVPREPGWRPRYTRLFFFDEAVALTAGFRPCAHCRRAEHARFKAAFACAHGLSRVSAVEIDERLRAAHATAVAFPGDLPDGTFVQGEMRGAALLKWGDALYRWSHAGYAASVSVKGHGVMPVITPEPIVRSFSAGYVPDVRLAG